MSVRYREWIVTIENKLDGTVRVIDTIQESYSDMIWYLSGNYDFDSEWEIRQVSSRPQYE